MTDAVQMLKDLNAWLLELAALERSCPGPHSPLPGSRSTDAGRLPFGIVIDDPDEPADATTSAGVTRWLWFWAHALRQHRHEPRDVFDFVSPETYMAANAEWAEREWPEWPSFVDELNQHHARLARRLGYADAPAGHCWCGGTLWRQAEDIGLTDWMICDGPSEHWYADADDWARACRDRAREITEEGRYWVRRAALETIWPGLKPDTLKKWAERGHVDRRGRLYDLAQVNLRMRPLRSE